MKTYNFEDYSNALKIKGIHSYRKHLKTIGVRARYIDPYVHNEKDGRLVRKEMFKNPWYTFREFLNMAGDVKLPEEVFTSTYSVFNNINTWIQFSNDLYHEPLMSSLISMALANPGKTILVYCENMSAVRQMQMLYNSIKRHVPTHLVDSSIHNIFITSSYETTSTSLISSFDMVVVIDISKHRGIDRFFKAKENYPDKRFIISCAESGNLISGKYEDILRHRRDSSLDWDDHYYELNAHRLKSFVGQRFLIHRLIY